MICGERPFAFKRVKLVIKQKSQAVLNVLGGAYYSVVQCSRVQGRIMSKPLNLEP